MLHILTVALCVVLHSILIATSGKCEGSRRVDDSVSENQAGSTNPQSPTGDQLAPSGSPPWTVSFSIFINDPDDGIKHLVFSTFSGNIKFKGAVAVLEGRAAIQRHLNQL